MYGNEYIHFREREPDDGRVWRDRKRMVEATEFTDVRGNILLSLGYYTFINTRTTTLFAGKPVRYSGT